jgi:hypothetical protein
MIIALAQIAIAKFHDGLQLILVFLFVSDAVVSIDILS